MLLENVLQFHSCSYPSHWTGKSDSRKNPDGLNKLLFEHQRVKLKDRLRGRKQEWNLVTRD